MTKLRFFWEDNYQALERMGRCTKMLVTGELCARRLGQCIHYFVSPPFGGQVRGQTRKCR